MAKDIEFYQKGRENKIEKVSLITYLKTYHGLQHYIVGAIFLYAFLAIYAFWANSPKKGKRTPILEVAEHWSLAKKNFKQQKYEKSLKHIISILAKDPKQLNALRLQIEILEKQKQIQDMRIACVSLFQASNLLEDFKYIARKTYKYGYYHQSLQYWEKAAQISPKYKDKMGDALFCLGHFLNLYNFIRDCPKNLSIIIEIWPIFVFIQKTISMP